MHDLTGYALLRPSPRLVALQALYCSLTLLVYWDKTGIYTRGIQIQDEPLAHTSTTKQSGLEVLTYTLPFRPGC